jgi:hypothetical protein
MMDGLASQALTHGIEAIKPLYAAAPEQFREQAIAMAMEYDPASIVATSHFLASGGAAVPVRSRPGSHPDPGFAGAWRIKAAGIMYDCPGSWWLRVVLHYMDEDHRGLTRPEAASAR